MRLSCASWGISTICPPWRVAPALLTLWWNSGAGALILPWRLIRAASTAEAVGMAQEAVGSPGNAVVNVQVVGTDLVITFADSTTRTDALPAGMGGGGGISIAQVDDRVEALVYTWAQVGDTTIIAEPTR